jgi:magnesium transporter
VASRRALARANVAEATAATPAVVRTPATTPAKATAALSSAPQRTSAENRSARPPAVSGTRSATARASIDDSSKIQPLIRSSNAVIGRLGGNPPHQHALTQARRGRSRAYAETMPRTRCYRNGVLTDENFPLADVSEHLEDADALVWIDLHVPDGADMALVAEELGLHTLAVQDALNPRQRPKLDRYPDHSFLNAYAVQFDHDSGEVVTSEVSAFLTPRALVTVRKNEAFDIDEVVSRWDSSADLAKHGIAFLVHGLLDYVVDTHFEAVQSLDQEIEELEDQLFIPTANQEDLQRRSFELRKSLVLLRRVVLPMRELVNTLLRRDLHLVDESMGPYFQDVYDHVLRATEWTESLRDLVTSILETNLTIQGNRLNIITKKVTSYAAIIAVPTAITGFSGQNVPYPGFSDQAGFWTSTGLIVGLSGLLFVVFRRKDWL